MRILEEVQQKPYKSIMRILEEVQQNHINPL
jgi:hypothetical protein